MFDEKPIASLYVNCLAFLITSLYCETEDTFIENRYRNYVQFYTCRRLDYGEYENKYNNIHKTC